jgi:hypothetical protein
MVKQGEHVVVVEPASKPSSDDATSSPQIDTSDDTTSAPDGPGLDPRRVFDVQ